MILTYFLDDSVVNPEFIGWPSSDDEIINRCRESNINYLVEYKSEDSDEEDNKYSEDIVMRIMKISDLKNNKNLNNSLILLADKKIFHLLAKVDC